MKILFKSSAINNFTKFVFLEEEADVLPVEGKGNQTVLIKEADFNEVKAAVTNVINKARIPESHSTSVEVWGFTAEENANISGEFLAVATTLAAHEEVGVILNFEKEGIIVINNGDKMFMLPSEIFQDENYFPGVDHNSVKKTSVGELDIY